MKIILECSGMYFFVIAEKKYIAKNKNYIAENKKYIAENINYIAENKIISQKTKNIMIGGLFFVI
jgi:hypothetical protein